MSSDTATSEAGKRSPVAIRVQGVTKHYTMFQRPEDRFKQMVVPRLQRMLGLPPRRYYRDFAALNGVSFEVGRGETIGIVGRNGSGKSTLLQIICGTLQPTAGTVEVNGRIAALLELGAGFNPEFTGRENVHLNATILGVPRKEMEWRFDRIASFADIGPFLDQPVKTYSSGMYMRLAFATAINVDPDILVVDEALAVGDEAFQRKCFARIEEIKESGSTILFVSHGAQAIVQLCTHAILMDSGEIILRGRPKLVVGQYQRLINANPEAAREIRRDILRPEFASEEPSVPAIPPASAAAAEQSGGDGRPATTGIDASQPVRSSDLPAPPSEAALSRNALDFFDPSLKSSSTIVNEANGARISDVRVTSLSGESINVLSLGKRYIIRYRVDFEEDAQDVSFATRVRTVQGLSLTGANTRNASALRIRSVPAGSVIDVQFEFNCKMIPSVYFISCSAIGSARGENIVLHRIVDAIAVRVSPEPQLIAVGSFDMDFQFSAATRPAA
ncbi:MAG: ABC transporter ATP-binding protein [Mesorhizobium sp.]|nr:ABC transporter ATP-binding protein [Mesorhizobium sp.]